MIDTFVFISLNFESEALNYSIDTYIYFITNVYPVNMSASLYRQM